MHTLKVKIKVGIRSFRMLIHSLIINPRFKFQPFISTNRSSLWENSTCFAYRLVGHIAANFFFFFFFCPHDPISAQQTGRSSKFRFNLHSAFEPVRSVLMRDLASYSIGKILWLFFFSFLFFSLPSPSSLSFPLVSLTLHIAASL